MLDTTYPVETPEGARIQIAPAGPPARAMALFVDLAARIGVYMIAGFVFGLIGAFFGGIGTGLYLIFIFLMEWFYFVFFEVFNKGQTPGKKALGIAVLRSDGTPLGWRESILRNLLRAADFLPFGFLIGLLVMTGNRRFQRLGDLVAGTVVVYRDSFGLYAEAGERAAAQPPPVGLTPAEQRALLDFNASAGRLSQARMAELAEILEPVTGARGDDAIAKLHSYAAWLGGSRL